MINCSNSLLSSNHLLTTFEIVAIYEQVVGILSFLILTPKSGNHVLNENWYFWAFSNNLYNQYLPSGSPPSPVSWNPEISLELFIFNAKFESTSSIVSITSPEAILHYGKINLIEGFLLSLTLQKHYTTTCF